MKRSDQAAVRSSHQASRENFATTACRNAKISVLFYQVNDVIICLEGEKGEVQIEHFKFYDEMASSDCRLNNWDEVLN